MRAARTVTAETACGRVEGYVAPACPGGDLVASFRGIPYGADPVGELRFREPVPAPGWAGTRRAVEPGPAAPQSRSDPMNQLVPGSDPAVTAEAGCLNLEVRAPHDLDPGARRPVMVWVHGGAFRTGSAALPAYDGARLAAEQDVVVVSPNYRLGALGFLDLPGRVAPNCGLSDLLLALAWVRDNAASFGGDPGNVTVFGESAGAGAILHLLAAPQAAGLFRRAILQSPGVAQALDRDRAALVAGRLLHHLGLPAGGAGLETVAVERLLEAQEATVADLLDSVGAMPFHPVVDGAVVAEDPLVALAAGRAVPVEAVVGMCADEMRLFATPALDRLDRSRLSAVLRPVVTSVVGADPGPEAVDDLVARYETSLAPGGGGAREVWAAVMTDGLMRLPGQRLLVAHAAGARPASTRAAMFAWRPGGPAALLGAFHAIDIPFTFGTFDRDGWGDFLAADQDAEDLSAVVRAAWAAFARDGRPERAVPCGWDPWEPSTRRTLVLDEPLRQVDDPLAEARDAWDAVA